MKPHHLTEKLPCTPPPCTILIAPPRTSPARPALVGALRPLRHVHEQIRALTGWGLEPRYHDETVVARLTLPVEDSGGPLSYLAAGDPTGQRILFIHGSPGHATEWEPYLEDRLPSQYRIAVDRPGFGQSQPPDPVPSIAQQARAIAPLLREGAIVVGYSFGGPVALQLALDCPAQVAGLVLIGCPADPAREYVHPIQRLAALGIVSRLLPQEINASNIEQLTLRGDLTDISDRLHRISIPVTLLQGQRDTLVPNQNADFLARRLTGPARPRQVLFPDGDHYLPWTYPETVRQAIDCVVADCGGGT